MSLTGVKSGDLSLVARLCERMQYQEAVAVLGDRWPGLGVVSDSDDPDLLLILGFLNSELGSIQQCAGAQEAAKDMLSRDARLFESIGDPRRADAVLHLSRCYWRCGEHDEAMVMVENVLGSYTDNNTRLHAFILKAVFQGEAGLNSLGTLAEAATLADQNALAFLRGKFHGERALMLRRLAESENSEELRDRAIIEYESSAICFAECGNSTYAACVTNNRASLHVLSGDYERAHAAVDQAAELLKDDKAKLALVHDQRAKIFLAEHKPQSALESAREAVRLLLPGDLRKWLQDCLTTQRRAIKAVKALETVQKNSDEKTRKSAERERIRAALIAADGVTTQAADILGLTQPGLAHKIQRQFPELAPLRKEPRIRRWKRRPA